MTDQDSLVNALVHALARDSSPQALRRAIAAIRADHDVSTTRAYTILVRATAGCPTEPQLEQPPVPVQRGSARGPLASPAEVGAALEGAA